VIYSFQFKRKIISNALTVMAPLLFVMALISCEKKIEEKLTLGFKINDRTLVLEGMTYDPVEENFYFGIFNKKKIIKVAGDGQFSDFIQEGQDNVTAITGINIDQSGHLWFCGSDKGDGRPTLFQYHLETGKLIHKFKDESGRARMFNDLTILPNKVIYITDSFQPAIYRLDSDSGSLQFVTNSDFVKSANGITSSPDGKYVFVSTSNGFARIETLTDSVTRVTYEAYRIAGIDGLYYYDNSLIGIQNVYFPATVVRYYLNEEKSSVIDAEVLVADHPLFNIPTTGALVDDDFYFMANSQLLNYDFQKDSMVNHATLNEISILKYSLLNKK